MPDRTHKLIFDSRWVAASDHDTLKERLQTRLGLDGAALGRLFKGRPVVIRRNLSADQARRLAEGLEALGAPCYVSTPPPQKAQTEPHLSDSLVVCPKCQHNQSPAEECHRCGLIFSRYRPGKPAPTAPLPDPQDARTPPEEQTPETQPAAAPASRFGSALATLNAIKTRLEAPFRKRRAPHTAKGFHGVKGFHETKGSRGAPPYLQVVISQTFRCLIYALVALVMLVVGIWFARGLWGLYIATQVGERYLAEFPEKAQAIVSVLQAHSLVLPVVILLVTLLVCAGVATTAHFLHLGRYLYQSRPWWWRLLVWYLPLAAAIGMVLDHIGLAPSMKLGGALALLPTLCLAPALFDLGQALVCEAGDLLARLRTLVHSPMVQLRERIASHLDR
jgi:hypothetical protein